MDGRGVRSRTAGSRVGHSAATAHLPCLKLKCSRRPRAPAKKLPQAVQMGPDLEGLPCGGGELGEVEKRLLLLPSDDDMDGVRLGTIELEFPMHPMGDAEHPAQLDPWTEEEENGSGEYEHRHSEL